MQLIRYQERDHQWEQSEIVLNMHITIMPIHQKIRRQTRTFREYWDCCSDDGKRWRDEIIGYMMDTLMAFELLGCFLIAKKMAEILIKCIKNHMETPLLNLKSKS